MTDIMTGDRRMRELIALAKTVAASKATVLVQGESGTGKELMASLVHENSNRASRPFVAINCAAIPENLLESELFGYERGAFTGAVTSKAGRFEFANGGTILLDEISEMDVRLQAKLLRVIQEGEVDRIGGRKPIPVDVRIIATTNRNLAECVKEGTFREDLFYRLNVVNLTLPPLRERIGDVGVLSSHFVKVYADKNGKTISGIAPEAASLLDAHNWPGNIRELENVVERAVITAQETTIQARDIVLERRSPINLIAAVDDGQEKITWEPGRTLDDIERGVILEALNYHQGNRTHTAKALGISIRTLRNKLADYRRLGMNV
ncbi:MAG: sigma-54-dependent Fis family transcriptional regulator [Bdellovibrionales bacterium]|nr:sigma-54-dependent Fis family transcriptional regulator [Bdellovibrionales bacterium]